MKSFSRHNNALFLALTLLLFTTCAAFSFHTKQNERLGPMSTRRDYLPTMSSSSLQRPSTVVLQSTSSTLPDMYWQERIDPASVTAQDLRSIPVTTVDGQRVALGKAMGNDVSVVVFLRHLGCTWCWSYVYQWMKQVQEQGEMKGVTGPIFVSIGDPDRLSAFLERFPDLRRDQFFVDGYDFAAYQQAGFGRFDEDGSIPDDISPKPVQLGGIKGWWTFMTNFAALAPVTPDMKFPEMFAPEGLYWVGGTIVVSGDDIIYRWNDRISGDHPEVSQVAELAQQAAAVAVSKKKGFVNPLERLLGGNNEA